MRSFLAVAERLNFRAASEALFISPSALSRRIDRLGAPRAVFITLGGMVASDVHGKNHHTKGSFGNHVVALTLVPMLAAGRAPIETAKGVARRTARRPRPEPRALGTCSTRTRGSSANPVEAPHP